MQPVEMGRDAHGTVVPRPGRVPTDPEMATQSGRFRVPGQRLDVGLPVDVVGTERVYRELHQTERSDRQRRHETAEVLRRTRVRGELGQSDPVADGTVGCCPVQRLGRCARPLVFANPTPVVRVPLRRADQAVPESAGLRRIPRAALHRLLAKPVPVGRRLPADLLCAQPNTERVRGRQPPNGRGLRVLRFFGHDDLKKQEEVLRK